MSGIGEAMKTTRTFPQAKAIARALGFRSVSEFCRGFGLARGRLYAALDGDATARREVAKKLGPSVALAILGEART